MISLALISYELLINTMSDFRSSFSILAIFNYGFYSVVKTITESGMNFMYSVGAGLYGLPPS